MQLWRSIFKRPSEYDGATCVCGKSLLPCKSFNEFKIEHLNHRGNIVRVYSFLGGLYYRIYNQPQYYCRECFWKDEEDEKPKEYKRKHYEVQGSLKRKCLRHNPDKAASQVKIANTPEVTQTPSPSPNSSLEEVTQTPSPSPDNSADSGDIADEGRHLS